MLKSDVTVSCLIKVVEVREGLVVPQLRQDAL